MEHKQFPRLFFPLGQNVAIQSGCMRLGMHDIVFHFLL